MGIGTDAIEHARWGGGDQSKCIFRRQLPILVLFATFEISMNISAGLLYALPLRLNVVMIFAPQHALRHQLKMPFYDQFSTVEE